MHSLRDTAWRYIKAFERHYTGGVDGIRKGAKRKKGEGIGKIGKAAKAGCAHIVIRKRKNAKLMNDMSKMTKVLLVLSLSFLAVGLVFVAGWINVGEAVWLYVTFPSGAILFGLFLISLSLQAESALFDEEHRLATVAINSAIPVVTKPCCEQKCAGKK